MISAMRKAKWLFQIVYFIPSLSSGHGWSDSLNSLWWPIGRRALTFCPAWKRSSNSWMTTSSRSRPWKARPISNRSSKKLSELTLFRDRHCDNFFTTVFSDNAVIHDVVTFCYQNGIIMRLIKAANTSGAAQKIPTQLDDKQPNVESVNWKIKKKC